VAHSTVLSLLSSECFRDERAPSKLGR
jgi:hypothetical protein